MIRRVASVALTALAAAIAWFGIRINAWYGGTLGKTAEASALIAGLSVSADLLSLALPATARTIWVRHRVLAGIAWMLWAVTIGVTLMATAGFAALNVTIAAESGALAARIDQLRVERAHITEMRSVWAFLHLLYSCAPSYRRHS